MTATAPRFEPSGRLSRAARAAFATGLLACGNPAKSPGPTEDRIVDAGTVDASSDAGTPVPSPDAGRGPRGKELPDGFLRQSGGGRNQDMPYGAPPANGLIERVV